MHEHACDTKDGESQNSSPEVVNALNPTWPNIRLAYQMFSTAFYSLLQYSVVCCAPGSVELLLMTIEQKPVLWAQLSTSYLKTNCC